MVIIQYLPSPLPSVAACDLEDRAKYRSRLVFQALPWGWHRPHHGEAGLLFEGVCSTNLTSYLLPPAPAETCRQPAPDRNASIVLCSVYTYEGCEETSCSKHTTNHGCCAGGQHFIWDLQRPGHRSVDISRRCCLFVLRFAVAERRERSHGVLLLHHMPTCGRGLLLDCPEPCLAAVHSCTHMYEKPVLRYSFSWHWRVWLFC